MLTPDHVACRELASPALVVDADAVRDNVARMAAFARAAGVNLRPHSKTHKTREIAQLQIEAGAVGICCATVTEAEALSAAGISPLLITSPTFGNDKFARIARLNRDHDVMLVTDHPAQVAGLAAALATGDPVLRILVDIDIGQQRTGVYELADGIALARVIAADRRLSFAGIQGYAGHVQHIEDPAARRAAASSAAEKVAALAQALRSQGLPPAIVTGSGTGTHKQDAAGPFGELQVGSYVFMDAEYARIVDDAGRPPDFRAALFVLATVVSVNRPGQFTVDAGTKVLATNGPPPDLLIGAPPGSSYRFGGDEHGMITVPHGQPVPPLGTRMLIRATHCDPTVNLHGFMHAVSGDTVERWLVRGRHSS